MTDAEHKARITAAVEELNAALQSATEAGITTKLRHDEINTMGVVPPFIVVSVVLERTQSL